MNSKDQIAQALLSQAVQPPAVPPPNPYAVNQPLEAAVADQRAAPLNPLIAALMNHFGILGMIRNRSNQPLQNPEAMQ